MANRRSRHQASRRRVYSARQRELRERRQRTESTEHLWPTHSVPAIEIADELDSGATGVRPIELRDRSSAA